MKLAIKSTLLGFLIYTLHTVPFLTWNHFFGTPSGYFSDFGWFIYGLLFSLWGYILASAIYIHIARKDQRRLPRYGKGLLVILFGYLLSRIPDIIDDDFFNKFSWPGFLIFLLLIPVLVEVEFWLRGKKFLNG